jgi:hypothetical protein
MDPQTIAHLTYRIEFNRGDGEEAPLGTIAGLLPAARAFEDAFARLVAAGERGTLRLLCDLGGCATPIAARRVAPGTAD